MEKMGEVGDRETSLVPITIVQGTKQSDPAQWQGKQMRTYVGDAEEVEMVRFNTVIRSRGKRGTKHDNNDGGDGWVKHFIGIISCNLHHPMSTFYYYPHFRVEETEKQRDEVVCAKRT